MKESVIKMVLDNNWADLNKYVESTAAKKIKSKIDQKKTNIVKAINEGSYLNSISAKNLKKGDIIYNFNGHKNVEVRDVYKQNHIINVYAKGIKNSKIYDENESVTLGDINEGSDLGESASPERIQLFRVRDELETRDSVSSSVVKEYNSFKHSIRNVSYIRDGVDLENFKVYLASNNKNWSTYSQATRDRLGFRPYELIIDNEKINLKEYELKWYE